MFRRCFWPLDIGEVLHLCPPASMCLSKRQFTSSLMMVSQRCLCAMSFVSSTGKVISGYVCLHALQAHSSRLTQQVTKNTERIEREQKHADILFCRLAVWFESLEQFRVEVAKKEDGEDVEYSLKADADALMRKLAAFHKTCAFLKQQVNDHITFQSPVIRRHFDTPSCFCHTMTGRSCCDIIALSHSLALFESQRRTLTCQRG
jgi:hypothetical protein